MRQSLQPPPAEPICVAAFIRGFRPEPEVTIAEWADEHRIMTRPSPEPGKWYTDRVPYTREIMEDLSPSSPVEISVLMKAAQGAGTEIGINAFSAWSDRYPDAGMWITPTVNTAKKFVRLRIDKVIEVNPRLKAAFAPARSRSGSNTVALKELVAGGAWVFCGANSGPDLRSYPARYAIMDEVDGYPFDLDGEGDPTELVIQRTAAYPGRKIFMLSTPTLEDSSRINKWYLRGDQRLYFVPCPLCQWEQPLIWYAGKDRPGGLRWTWGEPEGAAYQCEKCGDKWEEWRKVEAIKRGQWVAQAPSNASKRPIIRSRQINALYYPYGWPEHAWQNLAAKWEAEHKDPVKRKSFVNLKLGLPYSDPTEAKADADALMTRRESYTADSIPAGVAVLTVGADVQANRIEAELIGWGRGEESWSLEYRRFMGDTSLPQVWEDFDKWLTSEFMSELGVQLSIRAVCVDSGYQTEVVRKFCAERSGRRVWAIIGREGARSVWPVKMSKQRGKWPPAVVLGVDAAKESVYSRLKIQDFGPGYCHFSQQNCHDRDYFEMLTSEVRVPDCSGPLARFSWKKKTETSRNEALDCRGYGYGALVGLIFTTGIRLSVEADNLLRLAEAIRANPRKTQEELIPRATIRVARPKWHLN